MKPDPFVTAFSNFTPRPGAKVSIKRDDDPAPLSEEKHDEWSLPPRPDQCPTYQRVSLAQYVYWGLDWFNKPYVLTDQDGEVVTSRVADSAIVRSFSFK